MDYKKRIIDNKIENRSKAIGGLVIEGVKACGKSTTAKNFSNTVFEFQDPEKGEFYRQIIDSTPSELLKNKKPILFDEWQNYPKIWNAVRKYIDDNNSKGEFIFTGSIVKKDKNLHSGTGRISYIKMYPMSLYELGESNGSVSLKKLFDSEYSVTPKICDKNFDHIVLNICKGGWPSRLTNNEAQQLLFPKLILENIYKSDIFEIDDIKRDSVLTKNFILSYSRNICSLASDKTIMDDIGVTRPTYNSYFEALQKLFIIDEVEAWNFKVRSKVAIRTSNKRNIVDPSLAVAALKINPDYLKYDLNTLGLLFESLCFKELKIYSSDFDAEVKHYRESKGFEIDAVVVSDNGEYGIIECKFGGEESIGKAIENLNKFEEKVILHNLEEQKNQWKLPKFKMVLTALSDLYKTKDNVYVVPITELKN